MKPAGTTDEHRARSADRAVRTVRTTLGGRESIRLVGSLEFAGISDNARLRAVLAAVSLRLREQFRMRARSSRRAAEPSPSLPLM